MRKNFFWMLFPQPLAWFLRVGGITIVVSEMSSDS